MANWFENYEFLSRLTRSIKNSVEKFQNLSFIDTKTKEKNIRNILSIVTSSGTVF